MRWTKWLSLLCLLVAGGGGWLAQETGQICVLAFDDRNENGLRDANEPPIVRGVGLNLLNSMGVVIASKPLGDSPEAGRGLACFDGLPAGDYAVLLTSVDATAISASSFEAAVVPGAPPMRYDFALKPLTSRNAAASGLSLSGLEAVMAGIIASGTVGFVMLIVGLLIYLGILRPRLHAAVPFDEE